MRGVLPRLLLVAFCAYASPRASACGDEGPRDVSSTPEFAVDEREESPSEPAPIRAHEVDVDRAGMLAEGAASSHEIAFTFDDGPSPETVDAVLAVLAEHGIHAAFFLTGRRLAGEGPSFDANRAAARAIALAGHTIGNHGLDHLAVNRAAIAWNAWQIEESARLIERATGVATHLFRPPYGKIGTAAQQILAARGDDLVMWTLDAQDTSERTPEPIAKRLVQQLLFAGQGIVLLHDTRPASVQALRIFLDWLRRHPEYVVVDLPTYLEHAAARPYPFTTRLELYRERERLHTAKHAAIRVKRA